MRWWLGSLTPHAVYRYWNREGDLLYVGITADPQRRDQEHQRNSAWWPEASACQVTWFPTRTTALLAEHVAISCEHPAANRSHELPLRRPEYIWDEHGQLVQPPPRGYVIPA